MIWSLLGHGLLFWYTQKDPLACPVENKYTDLKQKCQTAAKWQRKCALDHQTVINIAFLIRKHLSFPLLQSLHCIESVQNASPNRCNGVYKSKTLFKWSLQLEKFQLTGHYFMRRNHSNIWQIHGLRCICKS